MGAILADDDEISLDKGRADEAKTREEMTNISKLFNTRVDG